MGYRYGTDLTLVVGKLLDPDPNIKIRIRNSVKITLTLLWIRKLNSKNRILVWISIMAEPVCFYRLRVCLTGFSSVSGSGSSFLFHLSWRGSWAFKPVPVGSGSATMAWSTPVPYLPVLNSAWWNNDYYVVLYQFRQPLLVPEPDFRSVLENAGSNQKCSAFIARFLWLIVNLQVGHTQTVPELVKLK